VEISSKASRSSEALWQYSGPSIRFNDNGLTRSLSRLGPDARDPGKRPSNRAGAAAAAADQMPAEQPGGTSTLPDVGALLQLKFGGNVDGGEEEVEEEDAQEEGHAEDADLDRALELKTLDETGSAQRSLLLLDSSPLAAKHHGCPCLPRLLRQGLAGGGGSAACRGLLDGTLPYIRDAHTLLELVLRSRGVPHRTTMLSGESPVLGATSLFGSAPRHRTAQSGAERAAVAKPALCAIVAEEPDVLYQQKIFSTNLPGRNVTSLSPWISLW